MAKTKSKAAYMISAVAERYAVHPQTLRLYEREGLLKPSRSEGNTRLYTDADLDRLALQAADVVLAATEAHRLGIAGAARVLDETKGLRPRPRCALVLSRVDDRRGLDRAAPDLLAGAFAVPVLAVRQDSALALALNAGGLPPASGRAAADLEAVAAWIDRTEGKGTP